MKRLPPGTPPPLTFFFWGRPCETDFLSTKPQFFCRIGETDFKADWGVGGRAERGFSRELRLWGVTRTFGDSESIWNHLERRGSERLPLRGRPGKPAAHPPTAGAGGAAQEPFEAGAPPPLGSQHRAAAAASPRSNAEQMFPPHPPSAPSPQPEPPFARPHLPRADKRTLPPSRRSL